MRSQLVKLQVFLSQRGGGREQGGVGREGGEKGVEEGGKRSKREG